MLNRLKEDPEHHVGVYVGHRIRSSLRQSRSPKLRRKRHNNYLPSIRQNSHDSRRQHQPRNRVIDRVEHAPALMPQLGFNLALQQMETDDMLVLSSLPSRQKVGRHCVYGC